MDDYLLKFTALEYNCDIFRHSRSNWSFFISFDWECKFLWWKNGNALSNRRLINNFNSGSIWFLKLIPCEFNFCRLNLDKCISCSFLKFIYVLLHIRLDVKLLSNLFSVLRKRVAGRKVAFNYRPVLLNWSVIQMYNLT
jgi:hypothetical protein